MLVWSDERVITYDILKESADLITQELAKSSVAERSFEDPNYFTMLFYSCEKCDNLLTAEGI